MCKEEEINLERIRSVTPIALESMNSGVSLETIYRKGLMNLGNTCFLNSAIQMLFSLENGFMDDLIESCGRWNNTAVSKFDDDIQKKNSHHEHQNTTKESFNGKESKVYVEEPTAGNEETMFLCCDIPYDIVELCWPVKDVELTQEEVEENAKKLHDSLICIGKKLTDNDIYEKEVDPTPLKRAIDAKTNQFAGYYQHDSHEFMTTMLDLLSQEEEAEVKKYESEINNEQSIRNYKNNIVDSYFCAEVKVTLSCCNCGTMRSRIEKYRHISLDVDSDKSCSLRECIAKFFEPDIREVQCEICSHSSSIQESHFTKLPRALLLHVKRFVVEVTPDFRFTYRKNNAEISFEEYLNLAQYYVQHDTSNSCYDCSDITDILCTPFDGEDLATTNNNSQTAYTLKSIIHHEGLNASRGHYTADVLTRNKDKKQWVRCSDSVVTSCDNPDQIIFGEGSRKTAYMFMYELL